ncbi:mitochondrial ribosome and complex I assembly factor AltMIEF1-like [Saccoglossus kowalevskii]
MPANMQWSRLAVLTLYRRLLRGGDQLKYTDKDYYKNYIRKEFKKNMNLAKETEKQKQFEKGIHFMESKFGGLL